MFKNGEGPSLKEDFRNRFRNVSRLMDCVGCDKCRLWGKLQTAGYGTALKVLFEFDNNKEPKPPMLKRTEIVALFNTYARLSSSMDAVQQFRAMVEERDHPAKPHYVGGIPDRAKKPRHVIVPKSEGGSAPSSAKASQPSMAVDDEDDERVRPERTVKHEVDDELARVLKAFRWVVKSWIALPGILWHIFTSEAHRLWQSYIGLPVGPRTWHFRDHFDEL